MINARESRKTIERERLEISSGKLEIPRKTFPPKMGTIKYRNGADLTELEDIKKRWQEYRVEIYKKKILKTQITKMV